MDIAFSEQILLLTRQDYLSFSPDGSLLARSFADMARKKEHARIAVSLS
jgi:hypothetical protein